MRGTANKGQSLQGMAIPIRRDASGDPGGGIHYGFSNALISRRRLLRLAAYAVPAATLVNMSLSKRILAQSQGGAGATDARLPRTGNRWSQVATTAAPPGRRLTP